MNAEKKGSINRMEDNMSEQNKDRISMKLFFGQDYKDIVEVLFKQLQIRKETEATNPKPIAGNNKFKAHEDFHIKKGVTYDLSLWGQIEEDKGYKSANLQIKESNRQE